MSSNDVSTPPDLAALIGSRICHDLISPVGAIGNGLELLSMSGAGGPEVALIADSVANANARIRFFRIAFGMAAPGQGISRAEILGILKDNYEGARLTVHWDVAADCRREEAKAAFLALQCLESALPYGGEIRVERRDGVWSLCGRSAKMKIDPEVWALLDDATGPDILPKHVHFVLLPDAVVRMGRSLSASHTSDKMTLNF